MKAIIFDWGGVLIKEPGNEVRKLVASAFNVSAKEFIHAYERYHDSFQRGGISEGELWEKLAFENQWSKPSSTSLWHDAFAHAYQEKQDVITVAKKLKDNGYKIGFLSNTEEPGKTFFQERKYDFFDVAVFSCAEGFRKPEPELYNILLQRLGIEANETAFVDDRKENVQAAIKLGMCGILYTTTEQLIKDLGVMLPKH
jgi:epoxide hydrolase-like predicted phosphatase